MGAAGPVIIFVLLMTASIIVGIFVLAYIARCVQPFSFYRIADTIRVELQPSPGAYPHAQAQTRPTR
jgi:hypothetical protein